MGYVKVTKDTKFRREVAERIGPGFDLPKIETVEAVPSVPSSHEMKNWQRIWLLWFAKTSTETQNEAVLGGVGVNTIIVTIQQEDSGGSEPACAWSAHIYIYKDSTRSFGTNSALRCPLLKSEMRTVLMMVTNVLGGQSLQMALIQRNNVLQEVSSTASHPPLRDAIGMSIQLRRMAMLKFYVFE